MSFHYSGNKVIQMLVYLMKQHNVRKVIISPGASHISLIGSLQHDPFFELYSAVDERGACYMACGLSQESGEPVAIACTGATASRNYLPGLSEAYYKKLPILAITAGHEASNDGQLVPQYLNRTQQPKDTVRLSVQLQSIQGANDAWDVNLKINRALLELRRGGGGPVHINFVTDNHCGLNEDVLSETRVIRRYGVFDSLPTLKPQGNIAISVGAHKPWSKELTEYVERFCARYNAVVLKDHSSAYNGTYAVLPTLCMSQELYENHVFDIDLLIHIGEQSGDYYTFYKLMNVKRVWRVSPDGEIRDTFHKLQNVFEMPEEFFFRAYSKGTFDAQTSYLEQCRAEVKKVYDSLPELPFSNIWLAKTMAPRVPEGAAVHLGVSNTMRAWTFFEFPASVYSFANVGCRGIDGALSTTIGMSLAQKDRLHFCVLGDLTFFYNMNALGNRNVGPNVRILLVNNGAGAEFHLYQHTGHKQMGEDVDAYVAAAGHNGKKSSALVRHYAEDLGFLYLTASGKEETEKAFETFLNPAACEQPMLLEVFTDCEDESEALRLVRFLQKDTSSYVASVAKDSIKHVLGNKGSALVRKIIK